MNTMSAEIEDSEPIEVENAEDVIEEVLPIRGIGTLVFGKWDATLSLIHN